MSGVALIDAGGANLGSVRYALERLLYRISVSPHAPQFLLKGALLFDLWFDIPHRPTRDADFLADLYCLVLNQLPAHYIRYGVDMIYFTSDEKRQEMEEKVNFAVTSAISWLDNENHRRNTRDQQ